MAVEEDGVGSYGSSGGDGNDGSHAEGGAVRHVQTDQKRRDNLRHNWVLTTTAITHPRALSLTPPKIRVYPSCLLWAFN